VILLLDTVFFTVFISVVHCGISILKEILETIISIKTLELSYSTLSQQNILFLLYFILYTYKSMSASRVSRARARQQFTCQFCQTILDGSRNYSNHLRSHRSSSTASATIDATDPIMVSASDQIQDQDQYLHDADYFSDFGSGYDDMRDLQSDAGMTY
jgi:hypothetical protein